MGVRTVLHWMTPLRLTSIIVASHYIVRDGEFICLPRGSQVESLNHFGVGCLDTLGVVSRDSVNKGIIDNAQAA